MIEGECRLGKWVRSWRRWSAIEGRGSGVFLESRIVR